MALDTFIEFFYDSTVPDFSQLERCHVDAGLTLEHPLDGRIVKLSPEGERIITSRTAIQKIVAARQLLTVIFWSNDPALISYATLEPLTDGIVRERTATDLLDLDIRIRLGSIFVERFKGLPSKRLLIVDFFGESVEFIDWRHFILQDDMALPNELPNAVSPTILGIEEQRFRQAQHRFSDYVAERLNSFVLVSRPAKLADFPAWLERIYRPHISK